MFLNKRKLFYISIFLNILIFSFPAYPNNFLTSTNFLTDSEFKQKNIDAPPMDISCNSKNSTTYSEKWYNDIKDIKLYFNVDKYFRAIIKKARLPERIKSQNDASRSWSKYRKGEIKFNNSKCKLKIEYRLTGDLSDHIGLAGGVPHSIKVKLLNSRIGNMTKFKLLRPETRSGKYEILNVIIHKKLGFMAPRTAITNIQIGGEKYKVIFQEDITKEFLQDNKIHEALLIEGDEGYIPFTNPKIINQKLTNSTYFKKISRDVMEIMGRVYLMTNMTAVLNQKIITDPPLLIDFLPTKDRPKFTLFYLLNYALKSSMGLTADDTRIVYDHISRSFHPIYYDGHHGNKRVEINFSFNAQQRNYLINELESLDLDELISEARIYGAKFLKFQVYKVVNEAIEILKRSKSFTTNQDFETFVNEDNLKTFLLKGGKELFSQNEFNKTYISWIYEKNKLRKCLISSDDLKCEISNLRTNFEYPLHPQNPSEGIFIHGLDESTRKENYSDSISQKIMKIGDNGSFIEYTQNLKLAINEKEKLVSIKVINKNNENTQLRVFGGMLEDWSFMASEDTNYGYKKTLNSRASKFGLTGCITFNDIELSNISIEIVNSNCEDAIHFVRVTGNLKKLLIKNADSDAMDADFSNLTFNKIDIVNAGNDCIDLSNGKYLIINSVNIGCNDKAVSAGENSLVDIQKILIKNTSIGLVSKDSSELTVKEAFVEDSTICVAAYRKKQEFSGGKIKLGSNVNCNGIPSYIHETSSLLNINK